ncbi:MAG: hypothetical protein L3K06_08070, partial [Thermoplasmata archaeon]|nr:hypothetical protein [Thermoplasmata archaeon]
SVLGDTLFYFHILQGARYESFWGTQRYELFKYASRVLEVARALGVEHQYLPIRRFLNKAAQIYEDHTPGEEFPGNPFSRAEDLVHFEQRMRLLQFDVVRQLLDMVDLSVQVPVGPVGSPSLARTGGARAAVTPPRRSAAAPTARGTGDSATPEPFVNPLIADIEANRQVLLGARRSGADIQAILARHGITVDESAARLVGPLGEHDREQLAGRFERAVEDLLQDQLRRARAVEVHVFVSRLGTDERELNPDYRLIASAINTDLAAQADPYGTDLAAHAETLAALRVRLRDPGFVAMLDRGVVRNLEDPGGFAPIASPEDRARLRAMAGPLGPGPGDAVPQLSGTGPNR